MTMTTRERLIAAAFALFDEQGYESTTVEQIAESAGVGRTTFFRNFRSKEDVIFPAHDEAVKAISDRLSTATADSAGLAVTEAASIVFRRYLDEGKTARSRYVLTSTVSTLRQREISSIQQYQRTFGRFIHQWLGGTPDTALRAELMANAVVTAHNHVLRRWLRGDPADPEALFAAAMAEVTALFAERGAQNAEAIQAILVLRTDQDLLEVAAQFQRQTVS